MLVVLVLPGGFFGKTVMQAFNSIGFPSVSYFRYRERWVTGEKRTFVHSMHLLFS